MGKHARIWWKTLHIKETTDSRWDKLREAHARHISAKGWKVNLRPSPTRILRWDTADCLPETTEAGTGVTMQCGGRAPPPTRVLQNEEGCGYPQVLFFHCCWPTCPVRTTKGMDVSASIRLVRCPLVSTWSGPGAKSEAPSHAGSMEAPTLHPPRPMWPGASASYMHAGVGTHVCVAYARWVCIHVPSVCACTCEYVLVCMYVLCAYACCVHVCMCKYARVCLAPPRPSSQAQGLSLDPPESRA